MLDIRNRILGNKKGRELTEDDIAELHHNMMSVYGWIPLEEFKALPMTTLFNLTGFVNKEIEKRENLRLCWLKFMGVKNPK